MDSTCSLFCVSLNLEHRARVVLAIIFFDCLGLKVAYVLVIIVFTFCVFMEAGLHRQVKWSAL